MSYELFQQGPGVYIPILLLSLVVTVFAYGAFPFILAKTQKKTITKKRYNFLCYGINFAVMILFIAVNGESSGAPFFLWTWIFTRSGLKTLANRGVLEGHNTNAIKYASSSVPTPKASIPSTIAPQDSFDTTNIVAAKDPVKATYNPNQHYCKCCGHVIDSSTKICTGCGKQYFKAKIKWGYVVLLIVFMLVGYVGINYSSAISAMNFQKFIESKQYFDNLFVSESVFADKYEYVKAGVLMEEGKYVEALAAFNKVDGVPVPATLIDSLKAKIYSAGQTAYGAEKHAKAKKYFNALTGYKRSADYLTLILCSEDNSSNCLGGEDNYKKLIKLLDFENANEIMLKYESTALEFLNGRWEDDSKNDPYYFEMEKTSNGVFSDSWSSGYNLPYKDADGYFYFSNGIFFVGETESSAVKIYRFTIINEDTISVYCYKDGSTHKLYRQ